MDVEVSLVFPMLEWRTKKGVKMRLGDLDRARIKSLPPIVPPSTAAVNRDISLHCIPISALVSYFPTLCNRASASRSALVILTGYPNPASRVIPAIRKFLNITLTNASRV